jgi:hypothetical protein
MAFYSLGAASSWKVADYALLLLTLLILSLLSGPKMRREFFRLLLSRVKSKERPKRTVFNEDENGERISVSVKKLPLEEFKNLIERTTSYTIICEQSLLEEANPVTIHVKNATIEEILDIVLAFQPKSFSYSRNGTKIFLRKSRRNDKDE